MKRIERLLIAMLSLSLLFGHAQAQDDSEILPALPGMIAYIGMDYNVNMLDPATNSDTQLTDDGTSSQPYLWPTWSTDGRLAYFQSMESAGQISTTVFISGDGKTAGSVAYNGAGELFTYAYWSPQDCDAGENCRDLAVLLSSADGLRVQIVRDSADGASSQLAGTGGPFYYSWSPDGHQMLWQRNNQRMDVYDVNTSEVETLPQEPGLFAAPAWSPVDDRLLFGILNRQARATDLVIVANGEARVVAPRLEGVVYFAWSPDGNKLAYANEHGPLYVVDAITGEMVTQSNVTGVLAFFWSPDSNRIAYITLATPPGSINAKMRARDSQIALVQQASGIAWSVMDVADGTTRRYGSFMPTQEMLYLLVYFDQFAPSHRIWSPDSRYLLYSETTPDGQASISILDTSQADVVPFSIAEGLIGVWSFS